MEDSLHASYSHMFTQGQEKALVVDLLWSLALVCKQPKVPPRTLGHPLLHGLPCLLEGNLLLLSQESADSSPRADL